MQSCAYVYIIFYAHAWVCVVPKTIHTSPTEEIFPYPPPPPPPLTSLEIPVKLHTFSKCMYLGL